MSNNNPRYQIKKALEHLKDIASQHEGCNILAFVAYPDTDSINPDQDYEIHLAYKGDPEVIEKVIVAATGLDEEYNAILHKAFATIKEQEK